MHPLVLSGELNSYDTSIEGTSIHGTGRSKTTSACAKEGVDVYNGGAKQNL